MTPTLDPISTVISIYDRAATCSPEDLLAVAVLMSRMPKRELAQVAGAMGQGSLLLSRSSATTLREKISTIIRDRRAIAERNEY
jgi:hypothetical protein